MDRITDHHASLGDRCNLLHGSFDLWQTRKLLSKVAKMLCCLLPCLDTRCPLVKCKEYRSTRVRCIARTRPRYQLGHASTRCAVTGCISILPYIECFDVLGFAREASFPCLHLLGTLLFAWIFLGMLHCSLDRLGDIFRGGLASFVVLARTSSVRPSITLLTNFLLCLPRSPVDDLCLSFLPTIAQLHLKLIARGSTAT